MGPKKKIKLDSIDACIESVIKEGLKITNEKKTSATGKHGKVDFIIFKAVMPHKSFPTFKKKIRMALNLE